MRPSRALWFRAALAGWLSFAVGGVLVAQETAATRTVEDLVRLAMANNAEMRAFEAEVAAPKAANTGGIFQNPEISTEIGAREVRDSQNALQGNGTTFSIAMTQTFEFPGKGTLRKAIANKNVEIAELGLEQFRLALAGHVLSLTNTWPPSWSLKRRSSSIARAMNSARNWVCRQALERGNRSKSVSSRRALLSLVQP